MAITIERCPHCGAPYMSAMLPGENPAERSCSSCNKRAGDPRGTTATPAPRPISTASSDDELSLQPIETAASAGVIVTHKQPDARGQLVGQIQSRGNAGVPGLPSDAPDYEPPPKAPLFTVASTIRLVVLLVVLVLVSKLVYGVYQREFDKPIVATAPPPAVPTVAEMTKPPPTPIKPVAATPPPKPVEKPPEVVVKPAGPPARPKELLNDGGGGNEDVNALIAGGSRQKSRNTDDDAPDVEVKKTPPQPPPTAGKTGTVTPPGLPPDNSKDPMIALLEKNKAGAQPPPGPNPPDSPPNTINNPPPPGGTPPITPGVNAPPPKTGMMPEGPIVSTTPVVILPLPGTIPGASFLRDYNGWFCRDYDEARSLRENVFHGRNNVVMLKPIQRGPAKLCALIEVPKAFANKKPELVFEITSKDPAHVWLLHATIEGAEVLRQTEVKITDAKPWIENRIDLTNFSNRRFLLQLEILPPAPGGKPGSDVDYAGYIRNMHLVWAK